MHEAVEHPGGEGVANELFEMGLEHFIVCPPVLPTEAHKANDAPIQPRVQLCKA